MIHVYVNYHVSNDIKDIHDNKLLFSYLRLTSIWCTGFTSDQNFSGFDGCSDSGILYL